MWVAVFKHRTNTNDEHRRIVPVKILVFTLFSLVNRDTCSESLRHAGTSILQENPDIADHSIPGIVSLAIMPAFLITFQIFLTVSLRYSKFSIFFP